MRSMTILLTLIVLVMFHSTQGEETSKNEYFNQLMQKFHSKMDFLDSKMKLLEQENRRLNSIIGQLSTSVHSKSARENELASCYELKLSNPLLSSGNYMIDPDGTGPLPPFNVYCDMATGTTQVSHDTEAPTIVDKCSERGCYNKSIGYGTTSNPITPDQMAKLVEISEGCRQSIRYDCVYAPLAFNGIQYSWWLDRDGTQRYYWSGSEPESDDFHACQCGLDAGSNSCIDNTVPCNCDALSVDPAYDSGVLTSKIHLPVTRVAFGRTIYSLSNGTYTLGKLECFGRKKFTEKPKNCGELSQIGQLNGYYVLPDSDKKAMTVVYCDMLDGNKETPVGTVGVQSKMVYLHAMSNTGLTAPITITYKTPIINEGSGLDPTTGIFSAPVSGIHLFTFVAYGKSGDSVEMLSKKSSDSSFTPIASTTTLTTEGALVLNVEIDLEVAAQVKVDLKTGELAPSAIFSGALLRENLVLP